MNHFRFTHTILAAVLLAPVAFIAGCGDEGAPSVGGAISEPAAWLIDAAPEGAVPVGQVKPKAEEGQAVVLIGRIGGRATPIASDSSSFTIVDPVVPHCGQIPDDSCPSPWDYCCEPRANLVAHSATVQLVDAAGAPLETDPIAAGLNPLDQVTVVGTVGARPSPEVLVIHATGIYRPAEQDHAAPKSKAKEHDHHDHTHHGHDHDH